MSDACACEKEEAALADPTPARSNWLTNNILAIIAMGVPMLIGYGVLTNKIDNIDAYRIERARTVDSRLDTITNSLAGLPNLSYRVTAQEEALKATNQRVDTSLSNISERLAEINQAIGALGTSVAVLTQKFEMADPVGAAMKPARR